MVASGSASPGASTAVSIMLDLLDRCFKNKLQTAEWQTKIRTMIPTYGENLAENDVLCKETRAKTSALLKLNSVVEG